jgi:aspartate/methionine/tyrosine aminotransferase
MIKKKIVIDKANRLYQLPPEILSLVNTEDKRSLLKRGDLLDLASFNWPVEFSSDTSFDMTSLRPASGERLLELQEALAGWMAAHHRGKINPRKEIYIGGPIRSTILALALAYVENSDLAFVPEIGIPLYRKAIMACGGEPISYPVTPKNEWVPDFERINSTLGRVARVLFLNSPHNPTGAELSEKEMAHLVWTAARENILVVNDAAYQGVPSRNPVSLLAMPGGKQTGVEVYSFSYLFGLPPLPFGFVAGNREVIDALKLSTNLVPNHIPELYIELALRAIRKYPGPELKKVRQFFAQTAAESNNLLEKLSLERAGVGTVPFVWAKIERRHHSRNAARLLYRRSRILVAPGTGFGESGQGFLRFSLTAGVEAYARAASRITRKMTLIRTKDDE